MLVSLAGSNILFDCRELRWIFIQGVSFSDFTLFLPFWEYFPGVPPRIRKHVRIHHVRRGFFCFFYHRFVLKDVDAWRWFAVDGKLRAWYGSTWSHVGGVKLISRCWFETLEVSWWRRAQYTSCCDLTKWQRLSKIKSRRWILSRWRATTMLIIDDNPSSWKVTFSFLLWTLRHLNMALFKRVWYCSFSHSPSAYRCKDPQRLHKWLTLLRTYSIDTVWLGSSTLLLRGGKLAQVDAKLSLGRTGYEPL